MRHRCVPTRTRAAPVGSQPSPISIHVADKVRSAPFFLPSTFYFYLFYSPNAGRPARLSALAEARRAFSNARPVPTPLFPTLTAVFLCFSLPGCPRARPDCFSMSQATRYPSLLVACFTFFQPSERLPAIYLIAARIARILSARLAFSLFGLVFSSFQQSLGNQGTNSATVGEVNCAGRLGRKRLREFQLEA